MPPATANTPFNTPDSPPNAPAATLAAEGSPLTAVFTLPKLLIWLVVCLIVTPSLVVAFAAAPIC